MQSSNNVYIPRINDAHTEQDVIKIFNNLSIGIVQHVDFVATKNPETKEVLFYSAFVRVSEWTNQVIYQQFKDQRAPKVIISNTEFWILLPAKTIISRSKINIHQLASYTDELFVKCANLEIQVNTQSEQISMQSEKISTLTKQLSNIMLLLQPPPQEKEIQLPVAVEEKAPIMLEAKKENLVLCDDECFFFQPLKKKSDEITPNTLLNLVKIAAPEPEPERSRSVSPENNIRVKNSFNFCGNE